LRAAVVGRGELVAEDCENPFLRYRGALYVYQWARARGFDDASYVTVVEEIDNAIATVDGRGFRRTPFAWNDALGCYVKDETGNVAGSHKARHLMGLAIAYAIGARLQLRGCEPATPWAIASCGNAALAAAVVAKASKEHLKVFVPTWADAETVDRLRQLGAAVEVCARDGQPGDPTVRAFRRAVRSGALPFSCQGTDVGLTIDGGRTLGFELAEADRKLGELYVQVGGGALASAVYQGLELAARWGVGEMPRINAVQTEGCAPLARAWARVQAGDPDANLERARRHRSEFMWPWEEEPASAASGILDDETYDWLAIAEALRATNGEVVVVNEDTLAGAHQRAASAFPVSHTGAAGYAGLVKERDRREVATATVLFTGIAR
jgi:threonine synthase